MAARGRAGLGVPPACCCCMLAGCATLFGVPTPRATHTWLLPCRHYMDRLLPPVISKRHDIAAVVSHRMPLSEAAAAYRLSDGRSGGCTRIVMRPW